MITKEINLRVWESNNVVVYANSGEVDSRYIEATFEAEEQTAVSLANRSVTFFARKPDGTIIFNNCTINTTENTATVELTSQALSVPGILECEFQIFDSGNVLLKANGLKIVVSSSEDFSEAIESTSEFNALISSINKSESIGNLSDLNTTQKGSVVGSINELNKKIYTAHILYSNLNGTKSTVTLSDSVANYEYIEVYYYHDANQIISARGYKVNGKSMELQSVGYYSVTNEIFPRGAVISFNNKTITWSGTLCGQSIIGTSNVSIGQDVPFSITNVIGFKKG